MPSLLCKNGEVIALPASNTVELWAPSQAFAVGQIITLSGSGEWSKLYGTGSDPRLDEAYDESVRYEDVPQAMFIVTAVKEGRVQARECNMDEVRHS